MRGEHARAGDRAVSEQLKIGDVVRWQDESVCWREGEVAMFGLCSQVLIIDWRRRWYGTVDANKCLRVQKRNEGASSDEA